ncbi:MAG: PH domain-containing protein [bacterium]|nr:PH domain-containing protein [bacterium]
MKQLHPRAVWIFFLNNVFFWLFVVGMILFNMAGILVDVEKLNSLIATLVALTILTIVATVLISYVFARLSYHFYRYELREDGFRKEYGIIWKKYVTIPYERIQNVDIYRGIIARILGLSDLHIQTAGMSFTGKYGGTSEGRLPGLGKEDAEIMRDELVRRARGARGTQGL